MARPTVYLIALLTILGLVWMFRGMVIDCDPAMTWLFSSSLSLAGLTSVPVYSWISKEPMPPASRVWLVHGLVSLCVPFLSLTLGLLLISAFMPDDYAQFGAVMMAVGLTIFVRFACSIWGLFRYVKTPGLRQPVCHLAVVAMVVASSLDFLGLAIWR